MMADWFAPKRYGYGAGLPIAWQGWALLIFYVAVIAGSLAAFHDKPLVISAIVVPVTMLLLLVTARTTRGGWRWRWGKRSRK